MSKRKPNLKNWCSYLLLLTLLGADRISQSLHCLLPDYLLMFAVPILSNVAWKTLQDSEECSDQLELLKKLQNAQWFVLEPLMHKNDNFSFSFYKVLVLSLHVAKYIDKMGCTVFLLVLFL